MFTLDGELWVRRASAARVLVCDERTVLGRAAKLGIRSREVPGLSTPVFALSDLQRAIAMQPMPARTA